MKKMAFGRWELKLQRSPQGLDLQLGCLMIGYSLADVAPKRCYGAPHRRTCLAVALAKAEAWMLESGCFPCLRTLRETSFPTYSNHFQPIPAYSSHPPPP